MTKIYFIFILFISLIFSIYNAGFEKRHNNISVLDEKKVKQSIETVSFLNFISKLFMDTPVLI